MFPQIPLSVIRTQHIVDHTAFGDEVVRFDEDTLDPFLVDELARKGIADSAQHLAELCGGHNIRVRVVQFAVIVLPSSFHFDFFSCIMLELPLVQYCRCRRGEFSPSSPLMYFLLAN